MNLQIILIILKNASQIANNISSNLNIQIFEKQELIRNY